MKKPDFEVVVGWSFVGLVLLYFVLLFKLLP